MAISECVVQAKCLSWCSKTNSKSSMQWFPLFSKRKSANLRAISQLLPRILLSLWPRISRWSLTASKMRYEQANGKFNVFIWIGKESLSFWREFLSLLLWVWWLKWVVNSKRPERSQAREPCLVHTLGWSVRPTLLMESPAGLWKHSLCSHTSRTRIVKKVFSNYWSV